MAETNPPTQKEPSVQIQERLMHALLGPAMRIAVRSRAPLKEVADRVEMAYFREVRSSGLRMREIGELLGVSMRKVAMMSKRLKRNFLPEAEARVSRRIEFLLWAEPLSRARIHRELDDVDPSEIDRALEELLRDQRLQRVQRARSTVYRRSATHSRLVGPDWAARLDGVENLLSNVRSAIEARLLNGDTRAFARTVSFYIRERDVEKLQEHYRQLWELVTHLERDAMDADDRIALDVSMLWAPNPDIPGRIP